MTNLLKDLKDSAKMHSEEDLIPVSETLYGQAAELIEGLEKQITILKTHIKIIKKINNNKQEETKENSLNEVELNFLNDIIHDILITITTLWEKGQICDFNDFYNFDDIIKAYIKDKQL